MKFVRYGGLSSVKQKGYDASSEMFHSPPMKRGIYAFVWKHVEWFLLSGYEMDPWKPHAKYIWVRDSNGNRIPARPYDEKDIEYNAKYNDYLDAQDTKNSALANQLRQELGILNYRSAECPKTKETFYIKQKKRRVFDVSDDKEVWHHLSAHVKQEDVLGIKGEWILTTVATFRVALRKEGQKTRVEALAWVKRPYAELKPFHSHVKDHLEVFFEKI